MTTFDAATYARLTGETETMTTTTTFNEVGFWREHENALEATIGPSESTLADWRAESEAERRAEDAWLRWAESDSPFSQQYAAEVEADLLRAGEPGLNASIEEISAWRQGA